MFEWPIFYVNTVFLVALLFVGFMLYWGRAKVNKVMVLQGFLFLFTATSMFLLVRIDGFVHGRLYDFGLRFDVAWAEEYWMLVRACFVVLGLAVASNVALLLHGRLHFSLKLQTSSEQPRIREKPQVKKRKTEPKPRIAPSKRPALMLIAEKMEEEDSG